MTDTTSEVRPGSLLLTPADVGERARDVLCVIDADGNQPGSFFALLLNRPTDEPAQPLAFSLFDFGDEVAWCGGPTSEPFALLEFVTDPAKDAYLPDGALRPFLTDRTAVFLPGRDHPPAPGRIGRRRLFHGAVWLSVAETTLYRDEGLIVAAQDPRLFDNDPDTLADRLRADGRTS